MRKIAIITLVAFALFACDNRDPAQPKISVTINNETLYTVQNYNTTDIYISLSGDYESLYANQVIDVSYNTAMANILTNSGDADFFVTGSFGGANGSLYTRSSGSLRIDFSVRGYDNVGATRLVTIYDPYIQSMQASPTTLLANGVTTSEVTVRIRPQINNQTITFTTSLGVLRADSTTTDSSGMTTNTITSTEPGRAEVIATFQAVGEVPPATRTIYITFTE